MAICERHRDLFFDIEQKGVKVPLRILQEKHCRGSDLSRAADAGNRLQIAAVLGLPSVPNQIRRDLVEEAQSHGLL